MGADFCYTYTTVEGSRKEWLETLEMFLHTDTLIEILVDTGYIYLIDDEVDIDEDGQEAYDKAVRELFANTINEVWDAIEHRSREVAVLEIGGEKILLTGGMSWGDSPTDIYDTINLYDDFTRIINKQMAELDKVLGITP